VSTSLAMTRELAGWARHRREHGYERRLSPVPFWMSKRLLCLPRASGKFVVHSAQSLCSLATRSRPARVAARLEQPHAPSLLGSELGLLDLRPISEAATEQEGSIMAWLTPTLVEICVGLEINGYLPAEF
jgi:coenzyme PQQ precursor peptide PqqA